MAEGPKSHPENSFSPKSRDSRLLGEVHPVPQRFEGLEPLFADFHSDAFRALHVRRRFRRINEALVALLQQAKEPAFLLAATLEYIDRVNREHLLGEPYRFADFEFYLNHFSGLSEENNARLRGKIAGRWIPREEYQCFFPIGMEKRFPGSHFVTAHLSPDVDSTVASFWGWMDAFAARIAQGLHLWSLPGGAPESPITHLMQALFDPTLFQHLARTSGTLTLCGMDLLTQEGFEKKSAQTLTTPIHHGTSSKAIVLVDEVGHYLGDWRSTDLENVRQVVVQFSSCLRWFENNLHLRLISFFTKAHPTVSDVPSLLASVFDIRLRDCDPALDFTEEQKQRLDAYLKKILDVTDGIGNTFGELAQALEKLGIGEFLQFRQTLERLRSVDLFETDGRLKEDRPKIFRHVQQIFRDLDDAILCIRTYIDRLDVMMATKRQVLEQLPTFITLRSDVEEIREKMKDYSHLTVVIPEKDGKWFPVGIVRASDLRSPVLGTVTLRDFCNDEEIMMASYLEVISVVDHHRSSLSTSTAPLALIGDAQSANVLVAEQTFSLNDRYGTRGKSPAAIGKELETTSLVRTAGELRIHRRLLQQRLVTETTSPYYVHPQREYVEYLCILYAILDDTDLLTKVTARDVHCVVELLNRMKSLIVGKEVEILDLDEVVRDGAFAKKAAQKILRNEDMYSLYKAIHELKEKEVEKNLELCVQGQPSSLFYDTKEQNGCCRIGQIKMFAANHRLLQSHVVVLRELWLAAAQKHYQEHPEVDLHLQMLNTIASADEVYQGSTPSYESRDEIWLWIPDTEQAAEHLARFLDGFGRAEEVLQSDMRVEFLGDNATELAVLFARSFSAIPRKIASLDAAGRLPLVVLHFQAGALNSRKASITPYLPKLIG